MMIQSGKVLQKAMPAKLNFLGRYLEIHGDLFLE